MVRSINNLGGCILLLLGREAGCDLPPTEESVLWVLGVDIPPPRPVESLEYESRVKVCSLRCRPASRSLTAGISLESRKDV